MKDTYVLKDTLNCDVVALTNYQRSSRMREYKLFRELEVEKWRKRHTKIKDCQLKEAKSQLSALV